MTEYEMEEMADMTVEILREDLAVEEQFIANEHELHAKLYAIDNLWAHLEECCAGHDHLETLNHSIYESILDMREFIDMNELMDLKFIKEEKKYSDKLNSDVAHRDWQAVSVDINAEKSVEGNHVRVQEQHLKELHSKFVALMKEMKESNIIKALEKDLVEKKTKKDYVKLEEHYFLEIYKFLRAYERILRHLWKKEKGLVRKIGRIS